MSWSTILLLIIASITAPFCEEVFFRSFIFMGLLRRMPLIWAMILSGFIFAFFHIEPFSFPILMLGGIMMAYLRYKNQSIWPNIAFHMLNNTIAMCLLFGIKLP